MEELINIEPTKENGRRKKLLIVLIILILFMIGFITFSSKFFVNKNIQLNVDVNNDGIPDVNIDINDDGKCDLNCDIDYDGKPDINIAHRNGQKATFNIDLDGDGVADTNLINYPEPGNKCQKNCDKDSDGLPDYYIDLNNNGNCDLNCGDNAEEKCEFNCDTNNDGDCDKDCDTNGDGICDLYCSSITCKKDCDLNGDGKCDINCDTDKDGIPDINIDINGDGVCDKECDTNNDGVCDLYCKDHPSSSSSSQMTSSSKVNRPSSSVITPVYTINYDTGNLVNTKDVIPGSVITKTFSVNNPNSVDIGYRILWDNVTNDFVTENLTYDVLLNGIYLVNGAQAPKNSNTNIIANAGVEHILINNQTHYFEIRFHFLEKGIVQNEDQGKTFSAVIRVVSAQ